MKGDQVVADTIILKFRRFFGKKALSYLREVDPSGATRRMQLALEIIDMLRRRGNTDFAIRLWFASERRELGGVTPLQLLTERPLEEVKTDLRDLVKKPIDWQET